MSKYIMCHSFLSPEFGWVDFLGRKSQEEVEILHVGYYARGERISQFGSRPDGGFPGKPLEEGINSAFTAVITPFGVVFRERELVRPGLYTAGFRIWGPRTAPKLSGNKLSSLIAATGGIWSPDSNNQLWRATPEMAAKVLAAIKAAKIGYAACGPRERLMMVAKLATIAADQPQELPVGAWLKMPGERQKPSSGDEFAASLRQLEAYAKEEETPSWQFENGGESQEDLLRREQEKYAAEQAAIEKKETELPRSSVSAGSSDTPAETPPPAPEAEKKRVTPSPRPQNPFEG